MATIVSQPNPAASCSGLDFLENRAFDEIQVGDSASLEHTLTNDDVKLFAAMSGDVNPAHLDEQYARSNRFHEIIAHGMWGGALISAVLGTKLPGPGAIYVSQTLTFLKPVGLGDTITAKVTASAKNVERHRVTFDCVCTNQEGETVVSGVAVVIAPTERVRMARPVLPEVRLHNRGARLRELIERFRGQTPVRTAVVHPVDAATLHSAVEAARMGIIEPVLIGPAAKIRSVAGAEGIDLQPYGLVSTEHSHDAAAAAVALARAGKVEALMKGTLTTEELMHEVVARTSGLCTGHRMSHVSVMDEPDHPRLMLITDAVLNIYPDLDSKRDIVQNAIDLARILGVECPKVALLAAVETVTPKLRSTLEAAALCKMADRGQITGGIVDGPLNFDNAVSPNATRTDGLVSPVAGQADILVVPDLEAGNLLVRQLESLAEADGASVVLGARVPIALTNHTDKPLSRLASCAIASLVARRPGCVPSA